MDELEKDAAAEAAWQAVVGRVRAKWATLAPEDKTREMIERLVAVETERELERVR